MNKRFLLEEFKYLKKCLFINVVREMYFKNIVICYFSYIRLVGKKFIKYIK